MAADRTVVSSAGSMKDVLIVDHDSEAARRLADVLAATGHMTRIAPSGLEGLRELESDPPDLILLDVEARAVDGLDMAEALTARAGKASIPIVVISASRQLEKIAELVGTPHYLRKPFGIRQAISLVNEALDAQPR
jgi:CheY-like chemotaxis protein